jgi:2,5-diamino-6-(ribosylamino)-4(3H)-pyrimidinone 5'-phosphate reductase
MKIIIHNSISLDGSLTGFEPHMGLHYRIAGQYQPQVHLIGSNTIRSGIEMFGGEVPPEEEADFLKPERQDNLPYWVIIDTRATLHGLLHTCRRFEYCRDVIVLVSEKTPGTYLDHLRERNYFYHKVGNEIVDLKEALVLLSERYEAKTILTDTGTILANLLINQGLADEISLLVHPVVVGEKSYNMFSDIKGNINLELIKSEIMEKDYIWLTYRFIRH